ncbi:MAG: hypothetical protein K2K37_06880 [Muribaculaceae bacterium]|nr:hypothetical protein [Muribaculaceae bacterium]
MKKSIKTIKYFALGAVVALSMASCSEEVYNLPEPDITPAELVEGLAYTVEPDAQNPNIIHLKSLMPASYQVAWVTPQGRKTGSEVTLEIPFEGDYEIQLGVNTRGGYVWSEPYTFTIANFCEDFVEHYLWKRISGGIGQSKTWQLDLAVLPDGSVKTTYWGGPHWYWNPNYTWDYLHASIENETINANYRDSQQWDKANAINPDDVPSSDGEDNANWYWAADYAGNSWMCNAENYGYITFDLINGANCTITNVDGEVVAKGTYMLDTDNHTLTFSGLYPLNSSNNGVAVLQTKLLYLSDTAMQLIPDGLTAGSATSLNYVTKDYFENYAQDETEPEPELPNGWRDEISQTVVTSVKWVFSDKNPLDWFQLNGTAMNNWLEPSDYPDWLGTPDPASYAGFSMTLDSKTNKAVFTYPDGSSMECEYDLDDKGIYTFSEAVPGFALVGWAWFGTTAENQLRILSIEKDLMGNVTGMWLGKRDPDKPEYMGYHFTPTAGNGGSADSDPLAPWKNALCSKTFTLCWEAFVDWINFDMSGGWTTGGVFGDDFNSNGWVWNEDVANVAKSTALTFTDANGQIMASLSYTKQDGTQVNESGVVTVKEVGNAYALNIPFDMVDFSNTAASWLPINDEKGPYYTFPLDIHDWLWVSHSAVGNNLSNVDENGFFLGAVSNAVAGGNDKDELLVFWWKLKQ